MKALSIASYVLFLFPVLDAGVALSDQPKAPLPLKPVREVQFEYAMLIEHRVLRPGPNLINSLHWNSPTEQAKVVGQLLHKQLLNHWGQDVKTATLFELLNYVGSQGWELCSVIPAPPPNPEQVNEVHRYIFKRRKTVGN